MKAVAFSLLAATCLTTSQVRADIIVFDFVKNEIPPLSIPGVTLQATVDTTANTMVLNSFSSTRNSVFPTPQTLAHEFHTLTFSAFEGSLATPWDVPDDGQSIIDAINSGSFTFVSDLLNSQFFYDRDNIPVNTPEQGGTGRVAWGAHITDVAWNDDHAQAWNGWFDADDLHNRIAWNNVSFTAVPEPNAAFLLVLACLYRRRDSH